jgi:aspartyl-tRNA(Asn)/glutamyl-tRNA(Gln) amidotransferase subunit B
MKFTPIVGLEIHIELKTKSKMFCSCGAEHFGQKPNTQVCPVCLGLPGALPVANKKAIDWTILVGLALNCEIPLNSKFDRKNYYYPDLPKGYQISQYDQPLAVDGKTELKDKNEKLKVIRIRRVHLEEDTAKLIHENGKTLINFNRSGVPLVEIVTEPDMESAQEAKNFLENLQKLIRALGISDADMEKGQMRCEPTVNLKIEDNNETFFTPLVEIKNINSFRFAHDAIEYEIKRQFEEFEKNREVKKYGNKTTRGWDEDKKETFLQRTKEEAADYRYFPEPDIPPLRWTNGQIANFKLQIMNLELPEQKVAKLVKEYGLSEYNAKILLENSVKGDYFTAVAKVTQKTVSFTMIANYIINDRFNMNQIKPEELPALIKDREKINNMDEAEIKEYVEAALKENPDTVKQFREGKTTVLEYLVGQVMKKTKGKGSPDLMRKMLKEHLNQ